MRACNVPIASNQLPRATPRLLLPGNHCLADTTVPLFPGLAASQEHGQGRAVERIEIATVANRRLSVFEGNLLAPCALFQIGGSFPGKGGITFLEEERLDHQADGDGQVAAAYGGRGVARQSRGRVAARFIEARHFPHGLPRHVDLGLDRRLERSTCQPVTDVSADVLLSRSYRQPPCAYW